MNASIVMDPLLQPYQLKHLKLKNRVMSTSHEPAYSEDGMPKERYRLYGAFQRAIPQFDNIPGNGPVFSAEAVMARDARPGKRVLVLDDGGNWKGCGTAWRLAEDGHEVTLVTPDALIGKELQRMAVDAPLRRALARLSVRFMTESAIVKWDGKAAKVTSLLTGTDQDIEVDALVFAATSMANDSLSTQLNKRGIEHTSIGDCTASRQAAFAIHDGRKVALSL